MLSCVHPDRWRREETDRCLRGEIDWDCIVSAAHKEGLSCLLYNSLDRGDYWGYVPEKIVRDLKKNYYSVSSRNILLADESERVIRCFAGEGIETIGLKGIFLAEDVYGNLALRKTTDMDILVRAQDLAQADKALRESGYYSFINPADILRGPTSSLNSAMYHKKSGKGYFVHLHWHIVNSSWPIGRLTAGINMEDIWRDTTGHARGTRGLSIEHQIIYLALHAFNHCFEKLIHSVDLIESFRKYKDRLDWEKVIRICRGSGISEVVYYSLFFAGMIFSEQIPGLAKLRPGNCRLQKALFERFKRDKRRLYILNYSVYLMLQPGIISKSRFVLRTFFPQKDVLALESASIGKKPRQLSLFGRIISNMAKV